MRLLHGLILGLLIESGLGQALIERGSLGQMPQLQAANTSTAGNEATAGAKSTDAPTDSADKTQASGTGFNTLTGPPPSATGKSVPLELGDATLGDYAEFTKVNGETAIRMSPPANGQASFSLDVKTPLEISTGEFAKMKASIRVGGENKRTNLQMFVDGSSVYDEDPVSTEGKFQQVTSERFKPSKNPKIKMVQRNGDEPVELTVKGVRIETVSSVDKTGPPGTDSSEAETGTGTALPTSSESETNVGRHDYMANNVAVYVVPLVAAFLL
ncbi:hypothetical protein ACJZ2D_016131 [Fusarium nematophilum]